MWRHRGVRRYRWMLRRRFMCNFSLLDIMILHSMDIIIYLVVIMCCCLVIGFYFNGQAEREMEQRDPRDERAPVPAGE